MSHTPTLAVGTNSATDPMVYIVDAADYPDGRQWERTTGCLAQICHELCYESEDAAHALAERIVRCVNSHDRLVQALEELIAEHEHDDEPTENLYAPDTFGITLARDALVFARGE